jgi:hypothetical protein
VLYRLLRWRTRRPVATGGEPRYDCSDCGVAGTDRPLSEMNHLYPVKGQWGTVWLNRCSACYWRMRDERFHALPSEKD